MNERLEKLIETFMRKLDSQIFHDQIYHTARNELTMADEPYQPRKKTAYTPNKATDNRRSATVMAEERTLINDIVRLAQIGLEGQVDKVQNSIE